MRHLGAVRMVYAMGASCLPLMKNCWPLAKNFAPLTEIVGRAVVVQAKHGNKNTALKIDLSMMMPGDTRIGEMGSMSKR